MRWCLSVLSNLSCTNTHRWSIQMIKCSNSRYHWLATLMSNALSTHLNIEFSPSQRRKTSKFIPNGALSSASIQWYVCLTRWQLVGWKDIRLIIVEVVQVSCHFSELVIELCLSEVEAANVTPSNRGSSLEVSFRMQTLHKLIRLNKVVRLLQFGLTRDNFEHRFFERRDWIWMKLAFALIPSIFFLIIQVEVGNLILTLLDVGLHFFLEGSLHESFTCHIFWQEESLSFVLETFHKSFSLQMAVKPHRWSNLFAFLSWSQAPCLPFWLAWRVRVCNGILLHCFN